jgi:spore germination cell wall hydrolase CwlJ-like protein
MNIQAGIFWIILTVFYEARGEDAVGQKSVAKVILNRAEKRNWPLENVVRARKQFSCYNAGIKNDNPLLWIKEIESLLTVVKNVDRAVDEWYDGDRLNGATHYYAPKGMPGGKPPYWIAGMTKIGRFGNHIFYREG